MTVTFKPSDADTIDAFDDSDDYQLAGIDQDARNYLNRDDQKRYTIVSYGQGFGLTKYFGPGNDPAALERAKAWIMKHAEDLHDNETCEEL